MAVLFETVFNFNVGLHYISSKLEALNLQAVRDGICAMASGRGQPGINA
jgi:hypothetical protein